MMWMDLIILETMNLLYKKKTVIKCGTTITTSFTTDVFIYMILYKALDCSVIKRMWLRLCGGKIASTWNYKNVMSTLDNVIILKMKQSLKD